MNATRKRRAGVVLGIGLLGLLFGGAVLGLAAGAPGLLPEAIGVRAEGFDRLFHILLVGTAFGFAATQGLALYLLLRRRGKAAREPGRGVELAWMLVPGLILVGMAVLQGGAWPGGAQPSRMPERFDPHKDYGDAGAPDTLEVRVLGKQFEWRFWYPGADRIFGTDDDVTKLAELHVPEDRWVIVHLRSFDVVHSFWVPSVRLKQDLIPGRTWARWFACTKTGRFDISCAEICGVGHSFMRAALVVESPARFRAWLRGQRTLHGPFDAGTDRFWKGWRDEPRE